MIFLLSKNIFYLLTKTHLLSIQKLYQWSKLYFAFSRGLISSVTIALR